MIQSHYFLSVGLTCALFISMVFAIELNSLIAPLKPYMGMPYLIFEYACNPPLDCLKSCFPNCSPSLEVHCLPFHWLVCSQDG